MENLQTEQILDSTAISQENPLSIFYSTYDKFIVDRKQLRDRVNNKDITSAEYDNLIKNLITCTLDSFINEMEAYLNKFPTTQVPEVINSPQFPTRINGQEVKLTLIQTFERFINKGAFRVMKGRDSFELKNEYTRRIRILEDKFISRYVTEMLTSFYCKECSTSLQIQKDMHQIISNIQKHFGDRVSFYKYAYATKMMAANKIIKCCKGINTEYSTENYRFANPGGNYVTDDMLSYILIQLQGIEHPDVYRAIGLEF